MAEFNIGQTFIHFRSTHFDKSTLQYTQKPKYFIALSSADYDDDRIVCFVMDTERAIERYKLNCNSKVQKFIIQKDTFSFIKDYTSIILYQPCFYYLREMYDNDIKLYEIAPRTLCKQIKNCINWNSIECIFGDLIKKSFKSF